MQFIGRIPKSNVAKISAAAACLALVLSFIGSIHAVDNQDLNSADCSHLGGNVAGTIINDGLSTGIATARVANLSNCTYQITFASYKMYKLPPDPDWVNSQTLFDHVTLTIQPHETIEGERLRITVPDCRYQIDLAVGDVLVPPHYGDTAGHFLLAFAFAKDNLCGSKPTPGTIKIVKTVRNLTAGQTEFVKSTSANPGDEVQFQIFVGANGGPVDQNLVSDTLPSRLTYVNNSLEINHGTIGNDLSNIVIGSLPDGYERIIKFRATVASSSQFNVGQTTLVNSATDHTNVGNFSDTANVVVHKIVANGVIDIGKRVRNVSQNQNTFVHSTNANPGDQVEFQMPVSATGGAVSNVVVSDSLPSRLIYVNNSLKIDGVSAGNNLSNISLGTVNAQQTKTVTLRATVAPTAQFQPGATTLVNTATVTSDSGNASDSASVVVNIVSQVAHLRVIKHVVGGAAFASDFTMHVSGTNVSNTSFPGSESGTTVSLAAGSYSVTESGPSGYTQSNSANCSGSIAAGESKTCAVTNNDNAIPGVITLSKQVRNVSQNQSSFVKSIQANPGDQVEFQIPVSVTGSAVTNVVVSDSLPSRLIYINNSLKIDGVGAGNNLSNVSLGTINASVAKVVTLRATVASANQFSTGTTTLANHVSLTSSTGNASDTADVVVNIGQQNVSLNLTKLVRNVSRGESSFIKTTNASPNEQVEFELLLSVSGNILANNVVVSDSLPSNFNLNFVSTDSGSVSGTTISFGNLGPGTNKTIKITATAASDSNFPIGSSTWTNSATATASNANSSSDTATVIVNRNGGGGGGSANLSITKFVRDITSGTGFAHSTVATGNDRIAFQITVTSTGNSTAQNVRLTDVLPANLIFSSGTLLIDNSTNFTNSLFNIFFGNMSPGQSHTVTFETTLGSTNLNQTLVNSATASADNTGSVSDTAIVTTQQILGANINLILRKKAFNTNKVQDATQVLADGGDDITYTLSVTNTGSATATNFVIQDDLSQVLNLADLMTQDGSSFDPNTKMISWPAVNILPGSTVEKNFGVRVRAVPANSGALVMHNVFGNTVDISIRTPVIRGTFISPKTGSTTAVSLVLSGLVMAGFVVFRQFKNRKFKVWLNHTKI